MSHLDHLTVFEVPLCAQVVVAASEVDFSLGTDTGGEGRTTL